MSFFLFQPGSIRVAISWCSTADCESSELVSASHDQIQKADEKNSWFSGRHCLVFFLDILLPHIMADKNDLNR